MVSNTTAIGHQSHVVSETTCRLGAIGFINTLPIYNASLALPTGVSLTYGTPAQLNQRIGANELDLSPVSAAYYLANQDSLTLLPGLSVSSFGGVESVLFLNNPAAKKAQPVIVPDDSATSVAVLKALWPNWFPEQTNPTFQTVPAAEVVSYVANGHHGLVIGDRALALYAQHLGECGNENSPPLSNITFVDMATEWQRITGTPLVFAVWVAGNHWLNDNQPLANNLMDRLTSARDDFFAGNSKLETAALAKAQEGAFHLREATIKRYWHHALNYSWTPPHTAGLEQLGNALTGKPLTQLASR